MRRLAPARATVGAVAEATGVPIDLEGPVDRHV